MIFRGTANDAINRIAIPLCIFQFFENDNPYAFPSHVAVRTAGEGSTASVDAQHARFAVADVGFWRHSGIHAACDRHLAISHLDS
ncbi:hypothetical protein D3C73_538500 [compost metagenome]